MINTKTITQAVASRLRSQLPGYVVERNPVRPDDPWKAAAGTAWIGVYRGKTDYEGHAIGALPWMANVEIVIEVQVCDLTSADACEDKLLDAEKAVLDAINGDRTLCGTVDMVLGYSIEYEVNRDKNIYYEAAIITVRAQARTS